jgi:hypothetical protein
MEVFIDKIETSMLYLNQGADFQIFRPSTIPELLGDAL